jgi:hypothetical protein
MNVLMAETSCSAFPPDPGSNQSTRRFSLRTYLLAALLAASSLALSALPESGHAAPETKMPPTQRVAVGYAKISGGSAMDIGEYYRDWLPQYLVDPEHEATFRMASGENASIVIDGTQKPGALFAIGTGTARGEGIATAVAYRFATDHWTKVETDLTRRPVPSGYERGVAADGRLILGGYVGSELRSNPLLTVVNGDGTSRSIFFQTGGTIASVAIRDGLGIVVLEEDWRSSLLVEDKTGFWREVLRSTPTDDGVIFAQVATDGDQVVVLGKATVGNKSLQVWTTSDLTTFQTKSLGEEGGGDGSLLSVDRRGFSIRDHREANDVAWESRDGSNWLTSSNPAFVDGVRLVTNADDVTIETRDPESGATSKTPVGSERSQAATSSFQTSRDGTVVAVAEWPNRRVVLLTESLATPFRQLPSLGLPRRTLNRYSEVASLAATESFAIAVVNSSPVTAERERLYPDTQEVWVRQGDRPWRKRVAGRYQASSPYLAQRFADGIVLRTPTGQKFTTDGINFSDLKEPANSQVVLGDETGGVALDLESDPPKFATTDPAMTWTEADLPTLRPNDSIIDVCRSRERIGVLTANGQFWFRARSASLSVPWEVRDISSDKSTPETCSLGETKAFISLGEWVHRGVLVGLEPDNRADAAPVWLSTDGPNRSAESFFWLRDDTFIGLGLVSTPSQPGDAAAWVVKPEGGELVPSFLSSMPELERYSTLFQLSGSTLIGGESNGLPAIWTTFSF